jgi:ribosomal protein S12
VGNEFIRIHPVVNYYRSYTGWPRSHRKPRQYATINWFESLESMSPSDSSFTKVGRYSLTFKSFFMWSCIVDRWVWGAYCLGLRWLLGHPVDTDYTCTTQKNIVIVVFKRYMFRSKTIITRLRKHVRYTLTHCFQVIVFVDGTSFTNGNQFHGIHPIASNYHLYRYRYFVKHKAFIVAFRCYMFRSKTINTRLRKHVRYTLTHCFQVIAFVDGTSFTNGNQFHGIHPTASNYHLYR